MIWQADTQQRSLHIRHRSPWWKHAEHNRQVKPLVVARNSPVPGTPIIEFQIDIVLIAVRLEELYYAIRIRASGWRNANCRRSGRSWAGSCLLVRCIHSETAGTLYGKQSN